MKSITLGLALSLLGGVAMAQTPPVTPSPAPKPPAAAGMTTPTPPAPSPVMPGTPGGPGAAQAAPQGQEAQSGQAGVPTPSGPPEGMIVETPNGFYLVRPGDPNPRRLDMGRQGMGGQGMGQPEMGRQGMGRPGMGEGPMGQNGPAAMTEGDDMMGDMAEDGMQPPRPRMNRPPHPPEGKGARFRIHTPNVTVGVKCPDDEPIKACVDAVSSLIDKANASGH